MDKKLINKFKHVLFLCCILSLLLCVPVSAKTKPVCASKQTVYVTDSGVLGFSDIIFIKNADTKTKIISVSSSNKLISAKAAKYCTQPVVKLNVSAKAKNGTKSNVTIKIKADKKEYTLKCTVTLKRKAPFSKIMIGNTSVKIPTATCDGEYFLVEPLTGSATAPAIKSKIMKLVPDAGININSIIYKKGNTMTILKNGSKVTLKKGGKLIVEYACIPENVSPSSFLCYNALMGHFCIDIE